MPAKSHAVSSPSGSRRSSSQFQIGLILPDVLGTYGDDGNALIVRQRLRLRGVAAEIIPIHLGDPVPDSLDLYTVGGGEDTAQILASEHLRADGGIIRAANKGTPFWLFALVCKSLGNPSAHPVPWWMALDCWMRRRRA